MRKTVSTAVTASRRGLARLVGGISHRRSSTRTAARQVVPMAPSCNGLAAAALGGRLATRLTPHAASGNPSSLAPPVLLLDVMDTVVYDPFFDDIPRFFGITFKELLAAKHPTAWVQFERDEIPEKELFRMFFSDGRQVDGSALRQHMANCYRYLDGMEPLLQRLAAGGAEMHAFSNYPTWWHIIEDKLHLSRYMHWTFVSCQGPLKGLRKPSAESFAAVVSHLQLPPERLLFVDDRQANVDGALSAGIPAIKFESAAQLEAELRRRGFQLCHATHSPLVASAMHD